MVYFFASKASEQVKHTFFWVGGMAVNAEVCVFVSVIEERMTVRH